MDFSTSPDGAMGSFEPQPVPSINHKTRGQKNNSFRQKKNRQNKRHADAPHGPPRHTETQSCYNCGSLEHWAQHCPEPRRELPAGVVRHPRPPKRQKTTGSAPYPQDPKYRGKHKPQRGYTHPPMAHPEYHSMPMPAPYAPPTPMSAQHSAGPWPPDSPPQYHAYPSYDPHGMPTPMSAYPPHPPHSPPSHGPGPHPSYFPPHGPHWEEEYRRNSGGYQNFPHYDGPRRPSWNKWRHMQDVPVVAPPIEPWMEELQYLDIPDPKNVQSQIVWRPPSQVARPLPSTFGDREEISMLPPITSLPPGMSVSKYMLDKGPEEYESNIRNTEDWPFLMKDPIFLEIYLDELVPVKELIERRNKLFETHRIQVKESSPEPPATLSMPNFDGPGEYPLKQEGSFYGSDEEGQDAANGDSSHDSHSSRSSYDSQSEVGDNLSHRSRGRANSFGSSVEHDDHLSGSQPSLENAEYTDHQPRDRRRDTKQPNNRFPKKFPSGKQNKQRNRRERQQNIEGPHQRSNNFSRQGNKNQPPFDRRGAQFKPQRRRNQKQRPFNDPTKNKQNKGFNGPEALNNIAPPSETHGHSTTPIKTEPAFQGPVKHESPIAHQEHKGPDVQTHERYDRKRPREDQSRSNANDEPRRQEDDVTPKFKRRQPQVAEAYSRRW
ncbi:hypothetical protein AJ80_01326 [Polytolypa hystricis UAMH7299]|uniref:CCHC-type domain-containing protein n=1 Tax=Polytolypa hystricis (strain UAMH7299) TaxID=1447883 RepID=A0A2B7YSD8_POLH7|nr:hypothetical protein AJ80_01326 [Polytolypa hystricis UAMH7299]